MCLEMAQAADVTTEQALMLGFGSAEDIQRSWKQETYSMSEKNQNHVG